VVLCQGVARDREEPKCDAFRTSDVGYHPGRPRPTTAPTAESGGQRNKVHAWEGRPDCLGLWVEGDNARVEVTDSVWHC